ncbi:hypothetical protein COV19_06455 [Candidatus Woesearchaeota archaeon CG10_big_fil_rev_8_21_14_0_10_44_13]|nr:MAG: hypothetical protein COV19_06455 [Candidatus Woesearchaeota archaeon CG10_big_fil_rev_8_21_14_0_10_44_13]
MKKRMSVSNCMKKARKAQMEMIGIAIVVVLLVIGMAFVFKALMKAPERTHEKFTKEQTAQSIIIAISNSDAGCKGVEMKELMQDCGNNVNSVEDFELGQSGSIQCGSTDSCRYLNRSLKVIFEETLKLQRLPYRFILYKTSIDTPILYIEDGGCNEYNIKVMRKFDTGKPGEQPLPLDSGGNVYARLDICTLAGRI